MTPPRPHPKESTDNEPITIDDLRNLMGELRMLARRLLQCESQAHSLTPTSLAMTALRRAKRLDVDWDQVRWENRRHFFSAISQAMDRALIDHARRRKARGRENVVYLPSDDHLLLDLPGQADDRPEVLMRVEETLEVLATRNPDHAELLRQFYFTGYNTAEIARFRGCSEKTIDRDLSRARVLFQKEYRNRS